MLEGDASNFTLRSALAHPGTTAGIHGEAPTLQFEKNRYLPTETPASRF